MSIDAVGGIPVSKQNGAKLEPTHGPRRVSHHG